MRSTALLEVSLLCFIGFIPRTRSHPGAIFVLRDIIAVAGYTVPEIRGEYVSHTVSKGSRTPTPLTDNRSWIRARESRLLFHEVPVLVHWEQDPGHRCALSTYSITGDTPKFNSQDLCIKI